MIAGEEDALSAVLRGLKLKAEVYLHHDFCGDWSVDTSGRCHIPFHLVQQGDCLLQIDGQQNVILKQGELVLFPHDHQHQLTNNNRVPDGNTGLSIPEDPENSVMDSTTLVCGYFEFASQVYWPLLAQLDEVIVIDMNQHDRCRQLLELLSSELSNRGTGSSLIIDQLAFILFIQILRSQIESNKLSTGLLSALFDPHIGKVLRAIHLQPDHDWNLSLLAEQSMMSRSQFADKFKAMTGDTAMHYLTRWRMRQAAESLMESNDSVAAIAERSGYGSEAAFRKAFKTVMGKTPGEVRRGGL